MREKRRNGEISHEMNITYYEDNNEIYSFKTFVDENPLTSLENISFQTGISINNLNRFIKQDEFKTFKKELKNNNLL